MRKVILLMHVSLDGFVARADGDLSWVQHDEKITAYVDDLIKTTDTALYGRTTYQMMESYWTTVPSNPASQKREIEHAYWVENVAKVVFSRTLERADWNNTTLVKDNIEAEISSLKKLPGKSLMIFGSPKLTHSLMELDLIDEYRINLNPVVLGTGIPLFTSSAKPVNLKLVESQNFDCGVVALGYKRIKS
jgi:dihydrofolate reductase